MRRMLLIAAALAAIAAGLLAVAAAGAEDRDRPDVVGDFVSRLADRLGITEDELTDAVKDVEIDMVNDAVAAGQLTEEQGAAIIDRIENGELRFPGGRDRPDLRCRAQHLVIYAAAEVLGMETDELKAELKEGKSLAQIAQEQGMSVDDFKAALIEQVDADLQAKVGEGKLTQEQKDRILEGFTNNVDRIINFVPEPGFPGRCHGHHGPPPDGEPAPES